MPPAVDAGGPARKPTAADNARKLRARQAYDVAASSAGDVLLRPGFLLGDTSLVVYFNGDFDSGDPTSFAQWWATVTDVESGQEQRSVTLGRDDLSFCQTPRELCRSFGAADGWTLDPARQYVAGITVVQADGTEATSPPSGPAKPRSTVVPPTVPDAQAAGCGCPTVLGPVSPPQALRGAQVNTATGAFVRTERDFELPSYGIPFHSTRFYSSANTAAGMFGPGWSWTYDAKVIAADADAVRVRAEDGSEAVYTRVDGTFRPPAGIRSKLSTVSGDGWQLVTPDQRTLRFDAEGRLTSVKNARGHGVTLAYTNGLLATVTDASNRVVRIENRTDLRLITKITLPDGRSTQFDYQNGRLLKVQEPRGFTHSYSYDAAGRLTEVTDARGNPQVRNAYRADGRVGEQRDPLGAVTRFEWFADRREAKTTDPDGVVIFDGYQGNVLLYSQNGNGDAVNHRYDERLRKGLVVDPKGNQEETRHDDEGNPVARTAPEPFSFTEFNRFDARNNLTGHTDGRGNTWKFSFNGQNEMTGRKDPSQSDGYRYEYDDRGLLTRRTDPRGKVTTYQYDAHGNRTSETSPTGRRTEFTYDVTGRMTSIVDPRGTASGKAKQTARKAADAKKKAKKSESCPVNSFAPGTRVVMADGTAKAIDTLEPGDSVLATDPATGKTERQQVTAAIRGGGDKRLVDLTLVGAGAGGGGPPSAAASASAKGGLVTATDGHPFWTFERGW